MAVLSKKWPYSAKKWPYFYNTAIFRLGSGDVTVHSFREANSEDHPKNIDAIVL
jgi:hypothetical protein